MKQLLFWFKKQLPLLAVLLTGLTIALTNIQLHSTYTGWDNLHGEFDLWRYTQQVLGGAWLEHQGLGAPMNLAHLAEIPRLPILWLLSAILPTNLIRITFIFLMYVTGGVTMYWYLARAWLSNKLSWQKNWLAALGGILYLLHILTLQQFYIAFEMFTVQFAFFPLLLLVLHRFTKSLTAKTLLLFVGVQLLLAPSGHTPTNFYLATLASQLYAFFLLLPQGLLKAIRTAILVGLITLVANFYWITPNIYYTFQDAHYVQESHDNQIFATESISSIREAGTWSNFLQNKQYLFSWKDYSFAQEQHVSIFDEWQTHLESPLVISILMAITLITILGVIATGFDKSKGSKRWAIILIYLACASFIWMGFLPISWLFDLLYRWSGSFTEAFRNPFTKLSIIYSVVSVILFVSSFEFLLNKLKKIKLRLVTSILSGVILVVTGMGVIYSVWPSFQGHFISDKLETKYPVQYEQLFSYLREQDSNLRILPLPQTNHAGWEYYDWQFLGVDNGYQGMGFYFFGVPQPVLHRDSDRWVESSDFFYHQLKYALDSQDVTKLKQVINQYQVDMILIDETRIEPGVEIDFAAQHKIATSLGFKKVWQKDFLTLYKRDSALAEESFLIPDTYETISHSATRTISDNAYATYGDYIEMDPDQSQVVYPFDELLKKEVNNFEFTSNSISYTVPLNFEDSTDHLLEIPGWQNSSIPMAITRKGSTLKLEFPQTKILVGEQVIDLHSIPSQSFTVDFSDNEDILLIVNQQAVVIPNNQTHYANIKLDAGFSKLDLVVADKPNIIPRTSEGFIDGSRLNVSNLGTIKVPADLFDQQQLIIRDTQQIKVETDFPVLKIDPLSEDSDNCSQPVQGEIKTTKNLSTQKIDYTASNYAVNCNGITLRDITTDNDYVLNIAGNNVFGRGLKFFIRRGEALRDDIVLAESDFNTSLTLHALNQVETTSTIVNWETRSHGQTVKSDLETLQAGYFPLQQIAQSKITSVDKNTFSLSNELDLIEKNYSIQSMFSLNVECKSENCVFALDQSYDEAWLAFANNLKVLPHYRYNGWANAWSVPEGEWQVYVIFWPQLLEFLGLGLLVGSGLVLVIFISRQNKKTKTKETSLVGKIKEKLRG